MVQEQKFRTHNIYGCRQRPPTVWLLSDQISCSLNFFIVSLLKLLATSYLNSPCSSWATPTKLALVRLCRHAGGKMHP